MTIQIQDQPTLIGEISNLLTKVKVLVVEGSPASTSQSSFSQVETRRSSSLRQGASAYLTKPSNADELVDTIRSCIVGTLYFSVRET